MTEEPSNKDLFNQTEELRQEVVKQMETVQTESADQVARAELDHRIDSLMERMVASEGQAKTDIDRIFRRYVLLIVIAFFLLLIIGGVNYFQILNPQAGRSVFELSEPRLVGPTELCPGEALFFEMDATVTEAGVYRLAMSTWRVSPPPATYTFSEGLDMVIAESREFPIQILWTVPPTFDNLATGKAEPWPSGDYSRDVSVTATGRNTTSDPRQIRFSIREDCQN